MDELASLYRAHIETLSSAYGRALEETGYDALVVHSGSQKVQSRFDDQHWPMKPTPAFAHWLPLREADAALVIVPGARPALVRTVVADIWDGPAPTESDHFWQAFELTEVGGVEQIGAALPRGRVAFIGEDVEVARRWGLSEEHAAPAALLAELDRVRAKKTDYERRCMAEANRRAVAGHRQVQRAFIGGGASELDLHLAYLSASRQDEAGTPYRNIVAVGPHAAVLHHAHYDPRPDAGASSLLVDAGATCLGYASDITRTTARGQGADVDLFRQLVAGIEAIQHRLCAELQPGASYEALHERAHQLLAGVLREVGIAAGSDDELVDGGVTRRFFPHGLGHSIGIQVHDVGCRPRPPAPRNPFLRATADVEPGHVFTIEPGCYFIDGLLDELRGEPAGARVDWAVVDRLRPFGGVRIEDNVAVLEDGPRNLTREAWAA